MDDRVGDILRSALSVARARGVTRPRRGDLEPAEFEHLASATLSYLSSRPSSPSPYPGWTQVRGFDAGVLRWWNSHLGGPYPSPVTRSLQSLRLDVYDFLDDIGRVVKEPGQTSPIHLAPPHAERADDLASGNRTIHVSPSGAGFGDAETNALVERAAMAATVEHFGDWTHDDVSANKVGWDITFTRGRDELHVEVKGVAGQRPKILLTRNELATARTDDHWCLAVVTMALVAPRVEVFDRSAVIGAAEPYAFIADMTSRRDEAED